MLLFFGVPLFSVGFLFPFCGFVVSLFTVNTVLYSFDFYSVLCSKNRILASVDGSSLLTSSCEGVSVGWCVRHSVYYDFPF